MDDDEKVAVFTKADIEAMIQEAIVKALNTKTLSDRTIHQKDIQILDARNIQLGRTNGTMIGTASDQKLGFFGTTPVVKATTIGAPSGGGSSSSDAVDNSARTAINSIRTALKNIGITS